MSPETTELTRSERTPADPTVPTNGLQRAVELGLRRVLGLLGRSNGNVLDAVAEPLSRATTLAHVQELLERVPGVVSLRDDITPKEIVGRAASGSAVLVPHEDGWICACGGGVRAPRVYLTGRNRERRVPIRKLTGLIGNGSHAVVAIEPGAALESLSVRATGSTHPATRLWALLRLEARDLVALMAFAVTLGGMSLAVPVAVQVLVNTIALGSLFQPLVVLALLLFAVLSFASIVRVVAWYAVEVLQRRVFVRVAEDFARRVSLLNAPTHERYDAPDLLNRFFEVVNLQKALSHLLIDVLGLVLQSAVGMALLAFYHPVFLAFDLALIGALGGVALLGFGAVDTAVGESKAKYAVARWLESLAAQPLMLTGAQANVSATRRADVLTREYIFARRLHYRRVFRQIVGGVGVQVLAMVALLGIGGTLVMKGELTLGQLVAAELVVGVLAGRFAKLGKYLETGYDLLASLDKIGQIVDLDLADAPRAPRPAPSTGLSVELRGIVAGMAKGPRSAEVSVTLEAKGRYRIAGVGTAEPSAILEVLAGHRTPLSGELSISEMPSDPAGHLRNNAMLIRAAQVLPVSVLDNLKFGDPSVDETQAFEALKQVGLADRVASLPEGVNTVLLASGAPLGRADVTRLSLARAWIAQPALLLVDGAFDELGLSEPAQEELLNLLLGPHSHWTVVAASDDPQVTQYLSQTIVLDQRTREVQS